MEQPGFLMIHKKSGEPARGPSGSRTMEQPADCLEASSPESLQPTGTGNIPGPAGNRNNNSIVLHQANRMLRNRDRSKSPGMIGREIRAGAEK